MRNPNQSSTLTRSGLLKGLELAYKMPLEKQRRFATALSKEMDEINDAYGGNCALGVAEVERVAASL